MEPVSGLITLVAHWFWAHIGHGVVVLIHKTLVLMKVKQILTSAIITCLMTIALWKIEIDPQISHGIYSIHHLTSTLAQLTIFASGIWSMGRVFTKGARGTLPFFATCVGLLLTAIPEIPSPWAYCAVVIIFWSSLLYCTRKKILWLLTGSKPRTH